LKIRPIHGDLIAEDGVGRTEEMPIPCFFLRARYQLFSHHLL